MKVLYVLRTSEFTDGGTIAWANMLESLSEYDVQPIVALKSKGSITDWLEKKGITYYIIGNQELYALNFNRKIKGKIYQLLQLPKIFRSTIKVAKILKKIIELEKPDIVHSNNVWIVSAYYACKNSKVKHLWHLREYGDILGYKLLPSGKYFRNNFLKNSYTVSITSDVAHHFDCMNNNKDFVVIDGVMPTNSTRYTKEKEDYFLNVGAGSPIKGCEMIVEAFIKYAKNAAKTTELWLVGNYSESYKHELITRFDLCGLLNRVKFLGFREDRYELMYKAKASIVASPMEGFGFVAVESIMNGCLLIGRNTTGTKFIMDQIENNALSFSNADELADKMKEISDNGIAMYENNIIKAQQIAARKFTFEQNGKSMYEVYKKILENG